MKSTDDCNDQISIAGQRAYGGQLLGNRIWRFPSFSCVVDPLLVQSPRLAGGEMMREVGGCRLKSGRVATPGEAHEIP